MRIIHRISVASSPDIRRELARLGIVVSDDGFVSFEVDEGQERWAALEKWILRRGAVDIARTKFSEKELSDAYWLKIEPDWHHGYPQPNEGEFGYRYATYDLSDWCEQCGIGMTQRASFQMRGEPKWGRNGILQLNWIFDEYFVSPEIWANVFKPNGIDCQAVMDTKGNELQTVVQLVVREEVGILVDGLSRKRLACPQCGRTKYEPVTRGRFPTLTSNPSAAMAKTTAYFGSGASAHKGVLVSQAIARALISNKIRGATFTPVAG